MSGRSSERAAGSHTTLQKLMSLFHFGITLFAVALSGMTILLAGITTLRSYADRNIELAAQLGRIVSSIVGFLNPDIIYLCDEIPQTERFRQMVYDAAISRMQPGADLVLAMQMRERLTKLDPCLLGAAQYVGDVCLEKLHTSSEL